MIQNKKVLTGIKPTGTPHLGNYIGAIQPIIELSSQAKQTYLFIPDLHALNGVKDPKAIHQNTLELIASFIALGFDIDSNDQFIYRQSDIPEIYQIMGLAQNVTPKGLMNRAHAYKAQVDKNNAAGEDIDSGVNMGLYNYPILMAADILAFNADLVPVGKDQKQHIEFARDIAGYFNQTYGVDYLKAPEGFIQEETQSIPGLDGRKMSKSYGNTLPIFEAPKKLRKLCMKIVTDSKQPEESKNPDESNIFNIYKLFAQDDEIQSFRQAFLQGGLGYGDAKQHLFEKLDSTFEQPREVYNELMANPSKLEAILEQHADKVRPFAKETLKGMKEIMLGR